MMSFTQRDTTYHLIKVYKEGVVGNSAVAISCQSSSSGAKITRPETRIILTDEERETGQVLIKCWEIGTSLQRLALIKDFQRMEALSPPATFVTYSDMFFTFNVANSGLQTFIVREFFEQGTLRDHIAWFSCRGCKYNIGLLDRWLIQLLFTLEWAHRNEILMMNLSDKNVCIAENGMDLRFVDYLPLEIVDEICGTLASPLKAPRDDHILCLFNPQRWTESTDVEAVGYLMLQLSIVGHSEYPRLKTLLHPHLFRLHWHTLMEAVWQTHGFWWMQTINKLLGEEFADQRTGLVKLLTSKIKSAIAQQVKLVHWGSGTSMSREHEGVSKLPLEQHNIPESSVLVSWIEQAWEFFQQRNRSDLSRIYVSMLKLVPTDRQSTLRSYHLNIVEKLFRRENNEDFFKHTLATLLAGILYADDVDKVACGLAFCGKLIEFLKDNVASPEIVCMLGTALAQIPVSPRKSAEQRHLDMTILIETAVAHNHYWPAFMPIFMCILQEAASMSTNDCIRLPVVPLVLLALQNHPGFPCEIHICLRLLRRLLQRSNMGAYMLVRFKLNNKLYSPVDTLVQVLKSCGDKVHIRREILLIAARVWSNPDLFDILMEDNWLKVFAALAAVCDDKDAKALIQQCLADRGLVVLNRNVVSIAQEPFVHDWNDVNFCC